MAVQAIKRKGFAQSPFNREVDAIVLAGKVIPRHGRFRSLTDGTELLEQTYRMRLSVIDR